MLLRYTSWILRKLLQRCPQRFHEDCRYPGGPHDPSARNLVSRHVERIVVHATELEIILRTRDAAAPSVGADGRDESSACRWNGAPEIARKSLFLAMGENCPRVLTVRLSLRWRAAEPG